MLDAIKPAYRVLAEKGVKVGVLGDRFFVSGWEDEEYERNVGSKWWEMGISLGDYLDGTAEE